MCTMHRIYSACVFKLEERSKVLVAYTKIVFYRKIAKINLSNLRGIGKIDKVWYNGRKAAIIPTIQMAFASPQSGNRRNCQLYHSAPLHGIIHLKFGEILTIKL